jgi:hypothetical protein
MLGALQFCPKKVEFKYLFLNTSLFWGLQKMIFLCILSGRFTMWVKSLCWNSFIPTSVQFLYSVFRPLQIRPLFACDEGSADCPQLFSRSSMPLSAQPQQSPARGGLSAGAVLCLSGAIGELHSV